MKPPTTDSPPSERSTLRVIAGFKLIQAVLLIAAGLGALGLLDHDWQHEIVASLDELALREGRRLTSAFASRASAALGAASFQRLVLIAIGCFVYAGVFVVEATGLWLRKRWAEYLTTIVTASLLPFEVMELLKSSSLPKLIALVINLLVLAYLIRTLLAHRSRG